MVKSTKKVDASGTKKPNIFVRAFKEKKLHKKWWFWLIVVGVVVIAIIGSSQSYKDYMNEKSQEYAAKSEEKKKEKETKNKQKEQDKDTNTNTNDNQSNTKSSDSSLDNLRKCTVMEAADVYNTKSNKAGENVFNTAKDVCAKLEGTMGIEEFNKVVSADWENRKNEQIEGHNLEYYLSILGW